MVDISRSVTLRLGFAAAVAVTVLSIVYVAVLMSGLFALPSPEQQIQQPWFSVMEVLIIAIAPAMTALTVAVQAWVPPEQKVLALAAVVFMSMCA